LGQSLARAAAKIHHPETGLFGDGGSQTRLIDFQKFARLERLAESQTQLHVNHRTPLMSSRQTIVLCCHWAFCAANFRGGLVRELTRQGHRVVVIVPPEPEYEAVLRDMGAEVHLWRLQSKGKSPLTEVAAIWHLVQLLRQIRPDVMFTYTIKPVIYGAMAGKLCRVPVISVITGLGYVFLNNDWISKLARRLYGWTLDWSKEVWFLNSVDEQAFRQAGILDKSSVHFLPGEGVNTNHFGPDFAPAAGLLPKQPTASGALTFLMLSRLLKDKGVLEFVGAARIVKAKFPSARFQMLGGIDANNPSAIAPAQVAAWEEEGVVRHLGTHHDVRPAIQAADCVVLPSYREGLPRSLLEASAMQKPLIATDVPGCRDVVKPHITGLLCAPQNEVDLAAKMLAILELSPQEREQMGANGRAFVRREFDEEIVFLHYLQGLKRLGLHSTAPTPQDPGLMPRATRDGVAVNGRRETSSGRTRPSVKEDAPESIFG
jgi:glycosyltransferase involved in cell wall biosynthesis